jgi:hypothetical protein
MNESMPQAIRETHIGQAMSALRESCDEIDSLLGALTDRIIPVLRAPSPKTECCVQDKSVDETLETPLAGDIQTINARLREYRTHLKGIIARIEV